MAFSPEMVAARVYTFLNNMMLTEFAKQQMTWRKEVIWKLLSSVF